MGGVGKAEGGAGIACNLRRVLTAFGLALLWPAAAFAQNPQVLPEIQVISTSPFSGGGIDRDKVPALVQTAHGPRTFDAPTARTSPTRCSSASPA